MDRRSFLGRLSAGSSFLFFPGFARAAAALNPANFSEFGKFRILFLAKEGESGSRLVSLRSSGETDWAVRLPLKSRHSVVVQPGKSPRWAVVPEQDGSRAALVDLHSGTLHVEFGAELGNWFPGHGVFSPDGKTVFLPEFPEKNDKTGWVVERSVPEMKVIRRLETGAYKPHNLLFTKDKKTLVVGHYGRNTGPDGLLGDGGAVFLRMPAGERMPTPGLAARELALCHVELGEGEEIFVSPRSWKGYKNATEQKAPLLFGSLKAQSWRELQPPELKERFVFNFTLKYRNGLLAVNHLKGNLVSFWSRSGELLSSLDLGASPLGIEFTPDGRYLLVNTMNAELLVISAKTRKILRRWKQLDIGWSPHIEILS